MSASTPVIIQGEDRTLTVILKDSEGKAFDLTGATEITAEFFGHTANFSVTLTGTEIAVVSPAGGGKMTITLDETNSAALKTGTNDFEITVDIGTDRRKVQLSQAIEVKASLF